MLFDQLLFWWILVRVFDVKLLTYLFQIEVVIRESYLAYLFVVGLLWRLSRLNVLGDILWCYRVEERHYLISSNERIE